MKHTTCAKKHMRIWALCAATIFSGGFCTEFFKERNEPIHSPQNVYDPPKVEVVIPSPTTPTNNLFPYTIKPNGNATSEIEPRHLESVKSNPNPNQKTAKNQEGIGTPSVITRPRILSPKERLLNSLYSSELFRPEEKDVMKEYIEAFDAWPVQIRRWAASPTWEVHVLLWVRDQCVQQAIWECLIGSLEEPSANPSSFPTKQNLLDALHGDKMFNAEEKNSIEYYISNLTIDDRPTYDWEGLDACAISKLCQDCGSTNHQSILKWIDQQIKQKAQTIENEKHRIGAKIHEIMQQTEEKDEMCIICYSQDKLYSLPCKHYFHQDCITEWVANNRSCPICKHAIKLN